MSSNKENASLSDLMKIIESKPEIQLEAGDLFRNNDEINDVRNIIQNYSNKLAYLLSGGRIKKRSIFKDDEYLAFLFNVDRSDRRIGNLQKWIWDNASTMHGTTEINPGEFNLPEPIFDFEEGFRFRDLFRDIDLVFMDGKPGGVNSHTDEKGAKSGSIIDVFIITPEIGFGKFNNKGDDIYINLFNSASRLRF